MDTLLNELTKAGEKALPVPFDARAFTDSNGNTWIQTLMQNKYEKRASCMLYEADKPLSYYINFLVG